MKEFIIFSVLFLYAQLNFAQELTTNSRDLTLKLPVSSFFGDFFAESAGFGIGIEKGLKPSVSFSQEVSYIFHVNKDNSILTEDLEIINGVKLTTEFRKYLNKKEIPESGWFINTEMKNIFTKSQTNEYTSTDNEVTRYRGMLSANFGFLVYWDKNKQGNVTLELMGGGGLAWVNAKSSYGSQNGSSYSSDNGIYPWFNFDIKIGYILK